MARASRSWDLTERAASVAVLVLSSGGAVGSVVDVASGRTVEERLRFLYLREDGDSIVVWVSDLGEKEALLASDPRKFFTKPRCRLFQERYVAPQVDAALEEARPRTTPCPAHAERRPSGSTSGSARAATMFRILGALLRVHGRPSARGTVRGAGGERTVRTVRARCRWIRFRVTATSLTHPRVILVAASSLR